jgi:hypothetical protein
MTEIIIEHKILFFLTKIRNYLLPEAWNELTQKQLIQNIAVLPLFFFHSENKKNKLLFFSEYERLKLLYNFIENKKLFKIDIATIKQLADCMLWLIDGNKELYNFIIKSIKVNNKILFGPNNKFLYMTFGEFIFADTMFSHYHQEQKDEYLNKLIAILFREKKYTESSLNFKGDIRTEFNEAKINYDSKLIANLQPTYKAAILFNYHTIRKFLSEKYIYVFGSYKEQEAQLEAANSNTTTWTDVLKNMSDDILKIDKYAKQPVHTVLDYLNKNILASMKQD